MNNEFRRHKKSDAIKWVVVSVLILALVAGMLAVFTGGFRNWNPSTWFGQKDDTEQTDKPTDNGGAVVGDVTENGVKLALARIAAEDYADYGVSPLAENAYTLTATVVPATADNKLVDWSVAWKNTSSSWASGKTVTDYVTVTPQSDGALTAVVACVAAFGEQITVNVTSRQNSLATASTTVDYYAKVTGANYTVALDGKTYNITNGDKLPIKSSSATGSVAAVTTIGTLTESYDYTVTARLTDQAKIDVMAYEFEGMLLGDMGEDYSDTANAYGSFVSKSVFDEIITCKDFTGSDYWAGILWSGVNDFFKKYTGDMFQFDITVKGQKTGKIFTTSLKASADTSTLMVPVASVGVSSGSITF